jgi:uncharacterized OB-fold protein
MENRPFNDTSYAQYLNEARVMGSRCKKCGAQALPPRPICVSCYGSEMEWVELKGKGKLAAFTSIVVAPPFMAKEGYGRNNPYIVGVVELEEGVKAVARINGLDVKHPDQIRVGIPLQADFASKGEGPARQTSLVFKP